MTETLKKMEALVEMLSSAMKSGGATEPYHLARDIAGELRDRKLFHAGAAIGLLTTAGLVGYISGLRVPPEKLQPPIEDKKWIEKTKFSDRFKDVQI